MTLVQAQEIGSVKGRSRGHIYRGLGVCAFCGPEQELPPEMVASRNSLARRTSSPMDGPGNYRRILVIHSQCP